MAHVEIAHITHVLPDGRPLLNDVSFRIGDGVKAALVGPNGAGKTTLMRLIAGDLQAVEGSVASSGGLGVMRQFIGSIRDDRTVHDLLVSVAPTRVQEAADHLAKIELLMMERDDEKTQMRYAQAITDYTDAGGYDIEVLWDTCTMAALGHSVRPTANTARSTRSAAASRNDWSWRRCCAGPTRSSCSTSRDNYLDVPGKLWLEQALRETQKTVLLVSHDRQLLANAADRIVTVEGGNIWIHGGGFGTYAQARRDRNERLDELRRRWDEEHAKLKRLVVMLKQKAAYNDSMAAPYNAAQTRLRRFEEAGPPEVSAEGAADHHAPARRPDRQAGRHLREPGTHRSDEALQPGGLVRRTGGRPRLERLREVPLPPAAERRRREAHRRRTCSARGSSPATSPRPTPTPS